MSYAPRWDVEGRDWPNRASSRFVDTGRMRWHVQLMGPPAGEAPVMLMIHGTGAATHSWRALAPLLAEHFTIVAPDLPGHGFTTGRPPGGAALPAVASALGGLMETIGVRADAIVGHSAGAAVAVRMALDGRAAPKHIVGLNAALLPFAGLAARLFPTLAKLLFVNPLAPSIFARMMRSRGEVARFLVRSTGSRIDPAGVDDYARLFATPAHCAGALAMMADWDLDALARDLPRLATPLLLVHGEADAAIPIATARDAAARVGDGRLVALPGLGHLAHEEQPAVVAALIRDFLEAADAR